jgi:hypothetical protein
MPITLILRGSQGLAPQDDGFHFVVNYLSIAQDVCGKPAAACAAEDHLSLKPGSKTDVILRCELLRASKDAVQPLFAALARRLGSSHLKASGMAM